MNLGAFPILGYLIGSPSFPNVDQHGYSLFIIYHCELGFSAYIVSKSSLKIGFAIRTVKVNRKAQAKKIFAHYIAVKRTGNRTLQLID